MVDHPFVEDSITTPSDDVRTVFSTPFAGPSADSCPSGDPLHITRQRMVYQTDRRGKNRSIGSRQHGYDDRIDFAGGSRIVVGRRLDTGDPARSSRARHGSSARSCRSSVTAGLPVAMSVKLRPRPDSALFVRPSGGVLTPRRDAGFARPAHGVESRCGPRPDRFVLLGPRHGHSRSDRRYSVERPRRRRVHRPGEARREAQCWIRRMRCARPLASTGRPRASELPAAMGRRSILRLGMLGLGGGLAPGRAAPADGAGAAPADHRR